MPKTRRDATIINVNIIACLLQIVSSIWSISLISMNGMNSRFPSSI